jgi:hypothetical protein
MEHSYNRLLIRNIFRSLLFLALLAGIATPCSVYGNMEWDLYQVGNSRPVLTSLTPESALAGEVVELILLGANFESGVSSFAISGSGVKVIRTLVISQFQLRVTVSIDPEAPPGLRNIRVINNPPAGGSSTTMSFRVKPPPHPEPNLLRMSPSSAMQGDTLTTEMTGRAFVPGQTFVVIDGDGMQMDSVIVHDDKRISVKLVINELATPGRRNLAVVTPGPGGGLSQARAFMVQTAPYPVPENLQYSGEPLVRGDVHTVTIEGAGIRDVSRVMLPGDMRAQAVQHFPPDSIRFDIDIPDTWRSATLPILLSNPRPGGGVSDTVYVPVIRPRNNPPRVRQVLTSMMIATGETRSIQLSGLSAIFEDEDGDTLSFQLAVDEPSVFAEIRGEELYIRGNMEGRTNVTLIASDGYDEAIIQFPVSVFVPIPNKSPTLSAIRNIELAPSVTSQDIQLSGISAGAGEDQRLTVTATSSNTRLIPNPEIVYASPNQSGRLILRPTVGVTGTATITVRVRDNGGTDYNGVDQISRSFTVTVRNMEISESDDDQPGRFRLNQNYPNPFNPTTTIDYTIGEASFVRLSVFDVTGRPVQRLVEREQSAGTYSVTFTADKIPSGMYIYRLEAGSYAETRTMMLVK